MTTLRAMPHPLGARTKQTAFVEDEEEAGRKGGWIGAASSPDQLLAQAQASLAVALGPWQLVSAMFAQAEKSSSVTACGGTLDASYAGLLQSASKSACSAASYAVRAAQGYAPRCAAAARAAAGAKLCPGLDISNEQAQQTPWGVIWNGQANCLDPNLVPQVGAQIAQAQASVAAALAAKNAACPPLFRTIPLRPLHIGAGPSFSQLDPSVQASFGAVGAQMQTEGNAALIPNAQQNFADAFNTLAGQNPNASVAQVAQYASQFTGLSWTAQGAGQLIQGLQGVVNAAGQSNPAAAFMGVSVGAVGTAIAVGTAAGIVTAGVGAAIIAGLGIAEEALSALFSSPPPVENIGTCSLNYKPAYQIPGSYVWVTGNTNPDGTWSGTITGGPTSSRWRKFPDPSSANAADAWWYRTAAFDNFLPGVFTWAGNQDNWGACVPGSDAGNSTVRPIDLACYSDDGTASVFHQLELDNTLTWVPLLALGNAEVASALQGLQQAFFAAWKANREFAFNGLHGQSDVQVFHQVITRWNLSREGGVGYRMPAVQFAPVAPGSLSLGSAPYMQQLITFLQQAASALGGANLLDANNNLIVNTGVPKSWAQILPIHLAPHPGSSSSGSTLKTAAVATASVAAAGLATAFVVAQVRRTTTKKVLSGAWRGTKRGAASAYRKVRRLV